MIGRFLRLTGIAALSAAAGAAAAAPPRAFEAWADSPVSVRCAWTPDAAATGYRLYRDGAVVATLPAGVSSCADSGLPPNSTHTWSVESLGAGGGMSAPYTERTFAPFPSSFSPGQPAVDYDVVVAQASSGGVAAAIAAAGRGLRVALLEPTLRLGGMPVNGLSVTDLRRPYHAAGPLIRFRDTVRAIYAAEGVRSTGLTYGPRVAQQAMKALLWAQPGIDVYRRVRWASVVTRPGSAAGRRAVTGIVAEELGADDEPTGRTALFRASVFIDATDCGDIAAWAGAPFRLGREPRSKREPHAGVIYYDRDHDALLPGSTGAGDNRVMAYGFLVTVRHNAAAPPMPVPSGYDAANYVHTPAWKQSWAVTSGQMPNGAFELNQHPQGGDIQEINYRYAVSGWDERAAIERAYRNHALGYLYYIRTAQGQPDLALADDEYRDSGGFPPLLYVREGRRILGEQLVDESGITDADTQGMRANGVGIGDYPMDSHAVRPKTDWATPDMGEGEWWLYRQTPWHQLPLGILIPRTLDNVFVTTAVSATHVAFGTYRLEPVRMQFGEAAGLAAWHCIHYRLEARRVPARQVQADLLAYGRPERVDASLAWFEDVNAATPHRRAIEYLAARGFLPVSDDAGRPPRFRPDAPLTRTELARWAAAVAWRAGRKAPRVEEGVEPATRAEFAAALAEALPPPHERLRGLPAYADVPAASPANALVGRGLDSRIWDEPPAGAPFLLRPEAPITHADACATLYIALLGVGPLYYDNPLDATAPGVLRDAGEERRVAAEPNRPREENP